MKRFRWRLQRLLELKVQQELALRAVLFQLSRDIAAVRHEIIRREAALRAALAELGDREFQQRLPEQQVFMDCSVSEEAELDGLRGKLEALQQRRSETIDAFKKTKSSRESLERLRDESFRRYTKEALRLEQKELDENSQVTFARQLLQHRSDGGGVRNST